MITTPDKLSGIDLAIEIAEKVLGWPLAKRQFPQGDTPFVRVTSGGSLEAWQGIECRIWEPWHDQRAWWEIVEKLRSREYAFCLHNQNNNEIWDAAFIDERGGFHGYGQSEGEAVMRAALAVMEYEK